MQQAKTICTHTIAVYPIKSALSSSSFWASSGFHSDRCRLAPLVGVVRRRLRLLWVRLQSSHICLTPRLVTHSSMDRAVRVMGEVPVFSSHSSRDARSNVLPSGHRTGSVISCPRPAKKAKKDATESVSESEEEEGPDEYGDECLGYVETSVITYTIAWGDPMAWENSLYL